MKEAKRIELSQMKEGEKGKVVEIQEKKGVIQKLDALGLRLGVVVTKVSSQFLGGPVTLRVGNTQIAIGRRVAKRIIVEKI
jgi:ferrous iron transport protein A